MTWASFTHRYEELGGGEFPAFAWKTDQLPSHAHTGEVDSIDGFVMALSPWAVRELRFDETLGKLSDRYREAIQLRLIDELPRAECAAMMEVTTGTFDVLLFRAVRSFRKHFGTRDISALSALKD